MPGPQRAQADPDLQRSLSHTLVVFAKAPRVGLVKTRLSPPLSPEQAAELYSQLLEDVLEATGRIAFELELGAVLAVWPRDARVELADRAPPNFRVVAQQGNGLGERMDRAVAEAAASGAARILLRGSDYPTLDRDCVAAAMEALDDHDLVVSPDRDGGYGLIGLREPVPGIFDHPMSSGSLLEETLLGARSLGLRCALLSHCFDLDTVEDFAELERARAAGDTALCPRTIAYMDAHDLWRFTRS